MRGVDQARRGTGGARKVAGAAARGPALVAAVAQQGGDPGRPASKIQQRFARLVKKVERLRQRLRAWQEDRPAIDGAIAGYGARYQERLRLLHRMVQGLDAAYGDPAFGKTDRKKLAQLITQVAEELLHADGFEDVKALYNRYGRRDFDAEVADAEAADVDALKAMLDLFGLDPGDDVRKIDELKAYASAQLHAIQEEEQAARERRARRRRSPKQAEREARREAERQGASKAVQEVYRALAMALHPDREQDPVERDRKAELMREVNVAHEAKDLLRLLELQLELERVEPDRVSLLAEDRLDRYNRVLDEQARQLASELAQVEQPFRMQLELSPTARLSPADVLAAVGHDTAGLAEEISQIAEDLETFADVARLKAWLKGYRPARPPREAFDRDGFGFA